MRLQNYDTRTRYDATLESIIRLTPNDSPDDVRELILDMPAPASLLQPGQSVGVIVTGPHALGHKEHLRLYTIAEVARAEHVNSAHITLLVKRCNYIDAYSGESFPGIASNYLCDRLRGDRVTLAGPYDMPFKVPQDARANVLMIGMGTGIAPFRAFVKHIYAVRGGWQGQVRLFYGARTGLELLYMNDERNDFANYYDHETFKAFTAVSPRPQRNEPAALDEALETHQRDVWDLITANNTYVYIAGLEHMEEMLDRTFARMAGGAPLWTLRKAELIRAGRWTELIF